MVALRSAAAIAQQVSTAITACHDEMTFLVPCAPAAMAYEDALEDDDRIGHLVIAEVRRQIHPVRIAHAVLLVMAIILAPALHVFFPRC